MALYKIIQVLLGTLVLGITSQTTLAQEYTMCYEVRNGSDACMAINVDLESKLIYSHIKDDDDFEDVSTLEDYNTGFAASRVESQEGCFVRLLVTTIEAQVAFIRDHQETALPISDEDMNVLAVSLDNPEEEIGEELTNFCGDLPVYKLVKIEESKVEVSKRQVAVTFKKCVLLCALFPTCFTTTITVPTGSSITYIWLFG
ncbi:uncharacterized protein [Palaemon carinicauda]|uniref:uncharacterized protein n=1 Tax=Palaemon carinicauda TaxID=392227 RepID=UPI0035B64BD1